MKKIKSLIRWIYFGKFNNLENTLKSLMQYHQKHRLSSTDFLCCIRMVSNLHFFYHKVLWCWYFNLQLMTFVNCKMPPMGKLFFLYFWGKIQVANTFGSENFFLYLSYLRMNYLVILNFREEPFYWTMLKFS